MTRRKNHRRTRRKQELQETLEQTSKDSSGLVLNKSDADIENDNLDSTFEMDPDTLIDPNLRTPEAVMDDSRNPTDPLLYKDLSPKIIGKVTKIKLDLDIPECETESILEIEPTKLDITLENVQSDQRVSEDHFPKLESIQVEPLDTKLNDYLLDKTVSIDSAMKAELEAERTGWNQTSYSTADRFPRYESPAKVFRGVNRTSVDEDSSHRRDIKYQNKQNIASEKSSSPVSRSQTNDTINSRFTFEGMQKPEYSVTNETLLREEVHWHRESEIFPSTEQLNILKTVSEPETLRVQKYTNKKDSCTQLYDEFSKPQSIYSGNENTCYLMSSDTNYDMNCSRSSSPPAKRSRTALRFESETRPRSISSVKRPPNYHFINKSRSSPIEDDSEYAKALKTRWSSASCSPASVELPTVSDLEGKTLASEIGSQVLTCERPHPECIHCIQMAQPNALRVHILTIPFARITEFCSWLAKKIVELLRKGGTWLRRRMTMDVQQQSAVHLDRSVLVDELAQLVTTIRCENDHTVSILSEKVTHLSEELVQVRVRSEAALATLSTELTGVREVNNMLTGQLKSLHNALDSIQSKPCSPSIPPPPPPPPPPPSQPITPTTPNSSRSVRTPNRKCSTPLQQGRPAITVEDLLKVTLKKAPRTVKEHKANLAAGPRGPAVSLDMLRSVKLRSARRRSADQNSRSPRSTSLSMRSRPPPSLSLSPIMSGRDSPLSRILRQVDTNKRGSKRALSSPTHSEADLTKDSPRTFSIARHSRSHTVML